MTTVDDRLSVLASCFHPIDATAFEKDLPKLIKAIKDDEPVFVLQEVKEMLSSLEAFDPERNLPIDEVTLATRHWYMHDESWKSGEGLRRNNASLPLGILKREYYGALEVMRDAVQVYAPGTPPKARGVDSHVGRHVIWGYQSWKCRVYMPDYWFLRPAIVMRPNLYRLVQLGNRMLGFDAPFSFTGDERMERVKLGVDPYDIFENWIVRPSGAAEILRRLDAGLRKNSSMSSTEAIPLYPMDLEDSALLHGMFTKVQDGEWSAVWEGP